METRLIPNSFTFQYRIIGMTSAWVVFFLEVIYAITTILGFLSLNSPQDPIGDPYFTIMEVLIILIAPSMLICMLVVNAYATSDVKVYSNISLIFMILLATITSSVHFTILTVSRQIELSGLQGSNLFFGFRWPSVAYTLDILAWDWFFALSLFFAVPVFKGPSLMKAVRVLMIVSGVLSLAGLAGIPLADMQIRNIGIIGYAIIAPFVFLLIGIVFSRTKV
jgi:hypothetical protein